MLPLPPEAGGAQSPIDVKFSAMTFNMQFGQKWDAAAPDKAPVDLEATIDFIQRHPHDVIFLQEVEQALCGGGQITPAPNYSRIKEALSGYHSVFGYPKINPDELPFGIGLAIFSRTPLRNFSSVDLPAANVVFEFEGIRKMPSHRQLLHACTEIGGVGLELLNTHLQAFFMINATSNEHRNQRDMVEHALRKTGGPALMGGDFNCAPDEKVVEQFASAGFQTSQIKTITWRHRPYVMDHLFFNSGLRLLNAEVIDTDRSDHLPVSATYEIASPAARCA